MKRHEYLHSAIAAFAAAVVFLAGALIVKFVVLRALIDDSSTGFELFVYNIIPAVLFLIAALFVIAGAYAMYNEIEIEHGKDVEAKITGIKEYFYGKSTTDVHYNLFCEWKCPDNGHTYRYTLKNLPKNPKQRFPDNKITIRVSKKDPRLHFINF